MLRRIWQFLNRLNRRKTYRETIQAEKPIMFLPLDEENGTVFHDLSGHGYDAELRREEH